MQGRTWFERLWAGCDTLLLAAVFILLGVVWYSNSREASALDRAAAERRAAWLGWGRRPVASARPVDGLRVSNERTRVNSIARSMVASGWDRSPTSPAVDMREDGKVCEVLFALPEGIAQESVRVTAAGGVLTVSMKDDGSGRVYLQRIRIPHGMERADTLQTVISNDVLRVRICPAGG